MLLSVKPSLKAHCAYGAALAGLAAAVFCLVDSTAVAITGDGVSFALFPALVASYVVVGWVGGTFLCVLPAILPGAGDGTTCRPKDQGSLQCAVLVVIVAIVGAVFYERVLHGASKELGRSVGGVGITLLGVGFLVGVWLSRRPANRPVPIPQFLWRVMMLALVCVLWQPVNKLYVAPWLSTTSLVWNLVYLCSAVALYRSGVWGIRRIVGSERVDTAAGCLRATAIVAVAAVMIPGAVWWVARPGPIERDRFAGADAVAPARDHLPNVILVVMDTTRADHLSVYGYARNTTPHLQAFSEEAMRYAHAIAPAPWTLPSHASMFTGLLPTEHGASYHPRDASGHTTRPLPEAATTLAETLELHGYDTGGVVGNWVMLNRQYGMSQGFHYYDDRRRASLKTVEPDTLAPSQWLCGLYQHVAGRADTARSAEEVNESVFAWLDRPRNKPFFLFVNYLDPHHPYESHAEFAERLHTTSSGPRHAREAIIPNRVPADQWDAVARYDEEIAYLDACLGRLFAKLKADGLYDSSLIVVTADHGEAFGEHGYFYHSNSLYEEEIWVPLLIRYPGGRPRGVLRKTTSLVALSETILAHVGIETTPSARHRMHNPDEAIVSELHHTERRADHDEPWISRTIYVDGNTKVIIDATQDGATEVYDLTRDPLETRNVFGERPALAADADARLQKVVADARSRQMRPNQTAMISDELIRQLQTLGYVTE